MSTDAQLDVRPVGRVVAGRCLLCDTQVEFEAQGQLMRFTKHDRDFCETLTLNRLETMRRLLGDSARWRGEVEYQLSRALHLIDLTQRRYPMEFEAVSHAVAEDEKRRAQEEPVRLALAGMAGLTNWGES